MTYTLTLTDKQAAITCRALEAYSRSFIGQFSQALEDALEDLQAETKEIFYERRANIDAFLKTAERVYSVDMNKNPDTGKIAWDVMQVIRHRRAWDQLRDEEGPDAEPDFMSVIYDKPLKHGTEPLPVIERVEK